MNLDETGIPMFMGDSVGNIQRLIASATSTEPGNKPPTQSATRSQLRGQATHVALICDNEEVQRLLPQVVVGDHSLLTVTTRTRILEDVPSNVTLLRLKSRWMDAPLMQGILRAVARVLRMFPLLQGALLLDCCPAHLQTPVLRCARACGIQLLFVPAKYTWLLQPCDTHVFQKYKQTLRKAYCELRRNSSEGAISSEDWWRCIVQLAGTFMAENSWGHTFDSDGYGPAGAGTSKYILNQLEWDTLPARTSNLPSHEELQCLLPRNRALQWSLVARNSRAPPAQTLALPGAPPAREPICPSTRVTQEDPAAALPSPSASSAPRQWRMPRATRLLPPPLPPPATPPPEPLETTHAQVPSTQPAAATHVEGERAPKRQRTTETMRRATFSTDLAAEPPISARTRSQTSARSTNG